MLQIQDNNLKGKNTILSCTVANFNNADQAGKIVTYLKDLYLGGFSKEQITRVKMMSLELSELLHRTVQFLEGAGRVSGSRQSSWELAEFLGAGCAPCSASHGSYR